MSKLAKLEFRRLTRDLEESLGLFFEALEANGDYRAFHPHPLTRAEAKELCRYAGDDIYCVAVDEDEILAYGMLRGWDEGFPVPSLGIALHPKARGSGLSRIFMLFLHASARLRGASQVRIKVSKDNAVALALYRRLGYRFETETVTELIGFVNLADAIDLFSADSRGSASATRERHVELIQERIRRNIDRRSTRSPQAESPSGAPKPLIRLFLCLKFLAKCLLPHAARAKLRTMPSVQRVVVMFER